MNAYDVVYYPNRSYFQTHPGRLAAQAALMGLEPCPVTACRVLEIGCGGGANLSAMAAELPGSEFIGVDLASSAIEEASRSASELGLSNVTFLCADIGAIDGSRFGPFDYIIAHGVFSWVPEPVRIQILGLCGDALAENGVAYISYNAYPGCHQREMSRRMMRFHVRDIESPASRIGQGRSFLNLLVSARGESTEGYHQTLKEELKHSLNYHEAAFYHDDLCEVNTPYYFHEFMELASGHGLEFLAEADLRDMHVGGYAPPILEMLRELEDAEYLLKEQYLDFLKGRRFRQTLLCRDHHDPDRVITPDRIRSLRVAAQITPLPASEDPADMAEKYAGPKGSEVSVTAPAAKLAMRRLSESWPASVPFEELKRLSGEAEDEDTLAKLLIESAMGGVVEFRTCEPAFTLHPGEKPVSSPVARRQLQTEDVVTTLRHTRIRIADEPSRLLLKLMDGTRDRAALIEDISAACEANGLGMEAPQPKTSDPQEIRSFVGASLELLLEKLCRSALVLV